MEILIVGLLGVIVILDIIVVVNGIKHTETKPLTIEERNKLYWMNELQCLFLESGNEVVCVRGKDIEAIWTDSLGQSFWIKLADGSVEANPNYKPKMMITTKSGQSFSLTHESWMKCRTSDPEYRDDKDKSDS